jgi:hypothetical protein
LFKYAPLRLLKFSRQHLDVVKQLPQVIKPDRDARHLIVGYIQNSAAHPFK